MRYAVPFGAVDPTSKSSSPAALRRPRVLPPLDPVGGVLPDHRLDSSAFTVGPPSSLACPPYNDSPPFSDLSLERRAAFQEPKPPVRSQAPNSDAARSPPPDATFGSRGTVAWDHEAQCAFSVAADATEKGGNDGKMGGRASEEWRAGAEQGLAHDTHTLPPAHDDGVTIVRGGCSRDRRWTVVGSVFSLIVGVGAVCVIYTSYGQGKTAAPPPPFEYAIVPTVLPDPVVVFDPKYDRVIQGIWSTERNVTDADRRDRRHPMNSMFLTLEAPYARVLRDACGFLPTPIAAPTADTAATLTEAVLKGSGEHPSRAAGDGSDGAAEATLAALRTAFRAKNATTPPSAARGMYSYLHSLPEGDLDIFLRELVRVRVGATAASDSLCAADAHFAPALNLVVISTADLAYVELLLRGLQPWVLMLERNIPVSSEQLPVDTPVTSMGASPPLWNLDRVDQVALPTDGAFSPTGDGAGVHVYVVDSGVHAAHAEFVGRVGVGFDFVDNDEDPEDCHGHGTHCAGVALGAAMGVARRATLHALRVLGCDGTGSYAAIIRALNWIAENHTAPAVVSISLGGPVSRPLNAAVEALYNAGVLVVASSGNGESASQPSNACERSPASSSAAYTVGATDSKDHMAAFSNYGSCVNLFAPGVNVLSAGITSDTATALKTGTSVAAPLVAGAAAVYLGLNPWSTPQELRHALDETSAVDRIPETRGSPNRLLQIQRFTALPAPPPPPSPPPLLPRAPSRAPPTPCALDRSCPPPPYNLPNPPS